MSAHNFRDRTGEVYGRLTVIGFAGNNKFRNALWECVCECGIRKVVTGGGLNNTKSCGCLRVDASIKAKTTHGKCRTKAYKSWEGIKKRCLSPTNPIYFRYGGRGIKVCDKWLSFEGFHEDMGDRPLGTSIDRIDNNGDYCKENCTWSTPSQQARNRRTSRILEIDGDAKTLAEWSEISGILPDTIAERIKRGYETKDAVFRKLDKRGKGR